MIISKLELKILAMIQELPSWSEIYQTNILLKTWLNKLISILPILMTFFICPVILKYFFLNCRIIVMLGTGSLTLSAPTIFMISILSSITKDGASSDPKK